MKRTPVAVALAALLGGCGAAPAPAPRVAAPVVAPVLDGFDHIPVAVADLDVAAERFRRLGFTLKPGRYHANGIRNLHAKMGDRTYIELITAPAAVDALTATYRKRIAAGDGPAFLGLHAPDTRALDGALAGFGARIEGPEAMRSFVDGDPLDALFFTRGPQLPSPTDRAEHFRHPNTAEGIAAVWLAPGEGGAFERAMRDFGLGFTPARACTPQCATARVAPMARATLVLLPAGRAQERRMIVGVTIRVRDVRAAAQVLAAHDVAVTRGRDGTLFVPPEAANGMWIAFAQVA